MSMVSMLGKIVVAGLAAKGVGKMAGGGSGGGGVAGMLGGLLGGSQSGGGGLGGLLSGLTGGATAQQGGSAQQSGAAAQQDSGIGDILGSFMGNTNQTAQIQPTAEQDRQAEILLRAMLNAAKSDGQIDKAEQDRIVQHLGDVSDAEKKFVTDEMSAPLDTDAFIRDVPRGMEQQVYLMSLTSINLDSKPEAEYLHQLAQGLRISQEACNQIHRQAGAPQLYN